MRKVYVIGIGAGDPRHMTVEAIEALNAVDAVFLLDKGEEKSDLVHIREAICARFLTNPACRMVTAESPARDASGDYRAGVDAWHGEKARLYARLIKDELGEDEAGRSWSGATRRSTTARSASSTRSARAGRWPSTRW